MPVLSFFHNDAADTYKSKGKGKITKLEGKRRPDTAQLRRNAFQI